MCTGMCMYVEARRLSQLYHPTLPPSHPPPSFLPFLIYFQGKVYHWLEEICWPLPLQPWDLTVGHHAQLSLKGCSRAGTQDLMSDHMASLSLTDLPHSSVLSRFRVNSECSRWIGTHDSYFHRLRMHTVDKWQDLSLRISWEAGEMA